MFLTYSDVEKIQKMGFDPRFFIAEHQGWLQLKNHKGRCVFHNGTRCTIYHNRPQGCSLYPAVYNKDTNSVILDKDCPQKHYFPLSQAKSDQLETLIFLLIKEKTERRKSKNLK